MIFFTDSFVDFVTDSIYSGPNAWQELSVVRNDWLNNPDSVGRFTPGMTCVELVTVFKLSDKPGVLSGTGSLVYHPDAIIALAKFGIKLVFFTLHDIENPGNRFGVGVQIPQIFMFLKKSQSSVAGSELLPKDSKFSVSPFRDVTSTKFAFEN